MTAWADLNERQQVYLLAIYDLDQKQEANERARGRDRRPADQWRWIFYGLDQYGNDSW